MMAEVFARYPNGGGEMLLALALADHAHDDGTSVRPSVRLLAEKTRQSERTVQYQLRNMEAAGWLHLVANAGGGRNTPREYRINPDWVKGANPAPLPKGATDDTKGCNQAHERVQNNALKGATAAAPEPLNHQGTIKEPSRRGSRLPPDWQPSAELLAFAASRGWGGARLADELDNFRDYWHAAPGAKGVKLDWDATFRTWIRKARNDQHDHRGGSRRESEAERVERINRQHDERERAAGLF